MKHNASRCPTCKQPLVVKGRKVCANCGKVMGKRDKWIFNARGRVEHRLCDDPENYIPLKMRRKIWGKR